MKNLIYENVWLDDDYVEVVYYFDYLKKFFYYYLGTNVEDLKIEYLNNTTNNFPFPFYCLEKDEVMVYVEFAFPFHCSNDFEYLNELLESKKEKSSYHNSNYFIDSSTFSSTCIMNKKDFDILKNLKYYQNNQIPF